MICIVCIHMTDLIYGIKVCIHVTHMIQMIYMTCTMYITIYMICLVWSDLCILYSLYKNDRFDQCDQGLSMDMTWMIYMICLFYMFVL